jgi:membrane protease YdiL (CAAX protease family)
MENLLIYLPFLVPAAVAQFGERQRWARATTYALLIVINITLVGLAGFLLINQLLAWLEPDLVEIEGPPFNWWAAAAACILTSAVACVPLIPVARRWLARRLPIDPESVVHTTALAFAVYQVGLSLGQMVLIGDLANLEGVDLALTVWDVLLTGILLLLFALVGVGFLTRRDGRATMERLGLRRPTWAQLALAVGLTILLLAISFAIDLFWFEVDPVGYDLLGEVTENIFGNLVTVGGAVLLGLSAGVSEELLFRGAVQPRLGLLLATILFAAGHLHFGLTLATLQILVIGLVLGLVRKWTNTTVCILIHAGYNTVETLLGLLGS